MSEKLKRIKFLLDKKEKLDKEFASFVSLAEQISQDDCSTLVHFKVINHTKNEEEEQKKAADELLEDPLEKMIKGSGMGIYGQMFGTGERDGEHFQKESIEITDKQALTVLGMIIQLCNEQKKFIFEELKKLGVDEH